MKGSIVIESALTPVYVVTFTGSVADEEFERYLQSLSKLLERRGQRALVYDARLATASPASQRQMQAAWMKEHEAEVRQGTAGIAFVLPTALLRGALTAILWIQPLACPHHVTKDFDAGLRWARERLSQFPPREGPPREGSPK